MKKFLKNKVLVVLTSMTAISAMAVSVCGATPTADPAVTAAVTDAFTGVELTAVATLGALAQVAIVLFAGIYAWKYGKKVFAIIAK